MEKKEIIRMLISQMEEQGVQAGNIMAAMLLQTGQVQEMKDRLEEMARNTVAILKWAIPDFVGLPEGFNLNA